jgi:hypothetical protein
MGLDTSHNCWHGPYSSFNGFRSFLAERIGINLGDYQGYGGTKDLNSIKHDIKPLFNHSDCDGKLTVEQCEKIANGLTSIINGFDDKIDSYFKQKTIQFRDGCLDAVTKKEIVYFR